MAETGTDRQSAAGAVTVEVRDRHVEIVRQKLLERSKVGIKKYGVTTDNANLSLQAWLQHLQEELMDATVYVEASLNSGK